jgi:hypothetical protein
VNILPEVPYESFAGMSVETLTDHVRGIIAAEIGEKVEESAA